MPSIKDAAAEFLTHQRVAVTGVSRNAGSHGSNAVYQRLRQRGYQVYAVNPNAQQVEGDTAYPDLRSIPGGVETVVIGTRPERAQATMEECAELGFKQCGCTGGPARQCVPGGGGMGPDARDDGHRRRLPAHVPTDLGRRAQGDALDVPPHRKRPAARLSGRPGSPKPCANVPSYPGRSPSCWELRPMVALLELPDDEQYRRQRLQEG